MAMEIERNELLKFFEDTFRVTQKAISKKLNSNNSIKTNAANPYDRTVELQKIHVLTLKKYFSSIQFLHGGAVIDASEGDNVNGVEDDRPNNSKKNKCELHYTIQTLVELQKLFPMESILKHHHSGDLTLITPWLKVVAEMSVIFLDKTRGTFEEGYLVIPLAKLNESEMLVFFPSNGLDANDEIPSWVRDKTLGNLLIRCDPSILKKTSGIGTVTLSVKDGDEGLILRSQPILPGDFLKVRSEYYQIIGFFQAYDQPMYNSVRFTKNIKRNANNANYDIIHQPYFKGNVAKLSCKALTLHHGVTIDFSKLDENNCGTLNIGFKNASFNLLGFLTHDVAV